VRVGSGLGLAVGFFLITGVTHLKLGGRIRAELSALCSRPSRTCAHVRHCSALFDHDDALQSDDCQRHDAVIYATNLF
jgi:hypothetical protein